MLEKNKQINFLKKSLIIIFIILALFVVLYFTSKSPVQNNLVLPVESNTFVRIKIPSINVDAPIESVGLTLDGAMDVPKGSAEVAWYKLGPRPGEIGSAVVAGHSGRKNNKPAVFDNLNKLSKGDKIYIEDEKGTIITFVVSGSKKYDPEADASGVFYSNDGKSHLNLVTCEGVWDEVTKSRSLRLVVFANKE